MNGSRERESAESTAVMADDQLQHLLEDELAHTASISKAALEGLLDDSRPSPKLAHVIQLDDDETVVERTSVPADAAPPEQQSETLQLDAKELAKLLEQ